MGVSDLDLPRILLLHSKGIQSFVPPRVNQGNATYKGPAITLVWPQELSGKALTAATVPESMTKREIDPQRRKRGTSGG